MENYISAEIFSRSNPIRMNLTALSQFINIDEHLYIYEH